MASYCHIPAAYHSSLSVPGPLDQGTEQLLTRLFENANFSANANLIHDSLSLDTNTWNSFTYMRSKPFAYTYYTNITQVPPQDIFQIISDLRNSSRWHATSPHTIEVLRRVSNRIASQHLDPGGSGSSSQGRAFPLTSSASSSHHLHPRDIQLTHRTDSAHNDINSFAGKTAPTGWKFLCDVCALAGYQKDYTRRGQFRAHMSRKHGRKTSSEDNSSLTRVSTSASLGEAASRDSLDMGITTIQEPHAPSFSPRPETVLADVVQARGPEIHIESHDNHDLAPPNHPYYDNYFNPGYLHQ
ncbi:hypothetical protein B0A52_05515 [Exophiala mesophila]|uniref:Uncharacterized protein n=1 Tax=Exophiala mesophila TaxID=212818 RepID=A0A438N361_EXOME|nr:hypothetical protein B0A52_05515 [Exophiala mesophila]